MRKEITFQESAQHTNVFAFTRLIIKSCVFTISLVSFLMLTTMSFGQNAKEVFTTLSGDLNSIDTLKITDSPFQVTGDIWFTSGIHVIDPGVVIMFDANTGLEIGQANFKCEGTASDSIVFTGSGGNVGLWDGVYFNNYSDLGVSSTMSYTRIENAGNGNWDSDLYCSNTSTPAISNCSFLNADGYGLRLINTSLTISNSLIEANHIGLYVYNASSISYLNNCTIQNNTNTGIRSNREIEMTNSLVTNNTVYEIDAIIPDGFPKLINSTILNAGGSKMLIGGGTQSVDRTWPYCSNGYDISGSVTVSVGFDKCRLTIQAGNKLRFSQGSFLKVGPSSNSGGELFAIGTPDSIITFTALDSGGDWEGLQFQNGSDSYGSVSILQYCVIEKGNTYNVYCNNTNQPTTISNCVFKNSAGKGMQLNSSYLTIANSTMESNHTGLYIDNAPDITYLSNCTIQNNTNTGIRSNREVELTNSLVTNNTVFEIDAADPNGFPKLINSTILEVGSSTMLIGGGTQTIDRIWPYCSNAYEISGGVTISNYQDKCRLTINAGNELKFSQQGYLKIGSSSSYGGELHATGTADSTITFTAIDPEGVWAGLQFENGSDSYGSISDIQHCLVEKGNTYNVYCSNTNQPATLSNCVFKNSSGTGVKLNTSYLTIANSTMESNHTGLYIDNAPDVTYLSNCMVQNNTNTGIRSNREVELTNSLVTNNTDYEIDAADPNGFPKLINSTILEVGSSKMHVGDGSQTVDRTWPYCSNGYDITGGVTISVNYDKCRLTIKAGNELRFSQYGFLKIGPSTTYGGELYAKGTADSIITFTALDPEGVWAGLQFENGSDSYGSISTLQYCLVEKGNTYNVYCSNTNQPATLSNCVIRNSLGKGLQLNNSSLNIDNTFLENNHTGLYINGAPDTTYLDNCTVQNNTNTGIRSNKEIELTNSLVTNNTVYEIDATDPNGFPKLLYSDIQEAGSSKMHVGDGTQTVDRTWPYCSNGYDITGAVTVALNGDKCRLTIKAGNELRFSQYGYLKVGSSGSYGGELNALGTADSTITFTSIDQGGVWNGLQFENGSDSYGSTSALKHCVVEKGNSYNVYCNATVQPAILSNCVFKNSPGKGLQFNNSSLILVNTLMENNHTGLYINGAPDTTYLDNCTVQNNTNTGIRSNKEIELTNSLVTNNTVYEIDAADPNGFPKLINSVIQEAGSSKMHVGDGTQTIDRTWPYCSNGYDITGSITISVFHDKCRLTIKAGSELRFSFYGQLKVGSSGSYGGELYANGTADSTITFTALDPDGFWSGIQFTDGSDSYGSTSAVQHCIIEKGSSYNINFNSTNQPAVLSNCEIRNSSDIGLKLNNNSVSIESCQIINNATYGIYINGVSNPVIGNAYGKICDLYYNGSYDVYNNTVNVIFAGSNFWNTTDATLISSRIYDHYDDSNKGIVFQFPIKQQGTIPLDEFGIDGKVVYNNLESTEINGLDIAIIDVEGSVISTTTTDAFGDYSFTNLQNANYNFNGSGATWGGSNATDALLILQHFAFINPLSGLNLAAADVNGSNSVNGTDALFVLQRFAAMMNSFPSGDWVLSDSATLYGSNLSINQVASCFGDVNASYTFQGKETTFIQLLADGIMDIESFEVYEVPIKVKSSLELGALSLVLNYPEEYIEITDVTFANEVSGLLYSADYGILTNAWANLDPIQFQSQEILLIITIQTKDLTGLNGSILIGLESISEIADGDAQVLNDVVLSVPELVYGLTAVPEDLELNGLSASNYPDPFDQFTTFKYNLPEDGVVQLQIFNSLGEQIDEPINQYHTAGTFTINFDGTKQMAGLYFYKLLVKTRSGEKAISGKMNISR